MSFHLKRRVIINCWVDDEQKKFCQGQRVNSIFGRKTDISFRSIPMRRQNMISSAEAYRSREINYRRRQHFQINHDMINDAQRDMQMADAGLIRATDFFLLLPVRASPNCSAKLRRLDESTATNFHPSGPCCSACFELCVNSVFDVS